MKQRFFILTVLTGLLAGYGCQQMTEESLPGETTWNLTVRAQMEIPGQAGNEGLVTKGLAIGDDKDEATTVQLLSIWKSGEAVEVYQGDTHIGTLTATPEDGNAHRATLSGTVTTSSITVGTTRLTLRTPRQDWDYTGQVGKLLIKGDDDSNSIEAKYHYTQAVDVLVTGKSGDNITTAPATFRNQQSIYRLSFRFQKGGIGDKTPVKAKLITLSAANGGLWRNAVDGTGPITVDLGTATTQPFFVALRNGDTTNEETLNFQVVDDEGYTYLGSKTIPAAYKPNGTFVSIKNATLTGQLGVKEKTREKVAVAL